ncbi:MAG TPA: glycosyltransferase family 2 protein [Verrucomicrobiae bacterium]
MVKSTIIVPVFNQAALTARCLKAVLESATARVVVVDDGSTDNTSAVLAGFGDTISTVAHPENRGFAAACNTGARLATSPYLVFLNNDTMPEEGWLKALEDYADAHPEASVVGSKLLYPDGRVQHAGVVICQDRYPRHIYAGFAAEHPAVSKSRRFQIVTAACMLVRRNVFEEAGGFDTAFRNGFEDVDLCLRLGAQGHEIHFCAESVVQHFESVSPGRFKHDRENVALYRRRWMQRVQPDDLRYYLEDGLLHLDYEGRYPIALDVSPLLATVNESDRSANTERALRAHSRQIAELSRDNTRLRLALGAQAPDSPEGRYQNLRKRIREVVVQAVPSGATVLVISKGDGALVDLPERQGWHFPQTERGAYAGHYPSDSFEAVAHLEALRERGAQYLLIPEPALWWLDHYPEFRQHLESTYIRLRGEDDTCVLYRLKTQTTEELALCDLQKTD